MKVRLAIASALSIAMVACATPPARKLLATWYIVGEASDAGEDRVLYLGLLNGGDESISVGGIIVNGRRVDEAAIAEARRKYRDPAPRGQRRLDSLTPGEISFLRLGSLGSGDWQCHLPISVAIVGPAGDVIKAEPYNPMPSSIPLAWQGQKCETDLGEPSRTAPIPPPTSQ